MTGSLCVGVCKMHVYWLHIYTCIKSVHNIYTHLQDIYTSLIYIEGWHSNLFKISNAKISNISIIKPTNSCLASYSNLIHTLLE